MKVYYNELTNNWWHEQKGLKLKFGADNTAIPFEYNDKKQQT